MPVFAPNGHFQRIYRKRASAACAITLRVKPLDSAIVAEKFRLQVLLGFLRAVVWLLRIEQC